MLGISSSCVNANSPYERGIQIEPSQTVFQSTHPSRGATVTLSQIPQSNEFQSTHPSRGATYTVRWMNDFTACQSTHPSRGATTHNAFRH